MRSKGPILLMSFTILVAIAAGLISFLPKTVVVESRTKITASHGEIRTYLNDPENWKTWFFNFSDSSRKFMKMGPERGVGAGLKWFSDIEGDGALEIKGEKKDLLSYELILENNQFRSRGTFYFSEELRDTITLVWQDTLDVSTTLMARIAARDSSFAQRIAHKNQELIEEIRKEIHAKYRRSN